MIVVVGNERVQKSRLSPTTIYYIGITFFPGRHPKDFWNGSLLDDPIVDSTGSNSTSWGPFLPRIIKNSGMIHSP